MGTTTNKPYRAYIRSRKWKRFRKQRIKHAQEKCEKCGRSLVSLHQSNLPKATSSSLDVAIRDISSKPKRQRKRFRTNTLQVHHVWYDNLYRETVEDTRVLCKTPCHKLADAKRKKVQRWLFKIGFYRWMTGKHCSYDVKQTFQQVLKTFVGQPSIKAPRYVTTYLSDGY